MTKTDNHKEPRGMVVSYFSTRFRQILYLCLAFCLVFSAGTAPRPVLAQAATMVSFSPSSAVINTSVGNTTVVDVVVINAVNIGAFTIRVNYDPKIVSLSQWVPGNFFADVFCFAPVEISGTLELACTKLGSPGNNGSGTLAKLTFQAVALSGSSPLNLEKVELVDSTTNQIVAVVVEAGVLHVNPYQIYLPLILKQSAPQAYLVPAEALAQATKLLATNEFSLALPGYAEAQS